jgi:hypothetical protein
MEADAFAEEHVFRPLGIRDYQWTRYPDGSIEADGGLALRPRDLAKIGRLFLAGGEWQQMSLGSGDNKVSYYLMPGYGGNILAVFPTFDMVIAFTGANYEWDVRSVYRKMFRDQLLPALR